MRLILAFLLILICLFAAFPLHDAQACPPGLSLQSYAAPAVGCYAAPAVGCYAAPAVGCYAAPAVQYQAVQYAPAVQYQAVAVQKVYVPQAVQYVQPVRFQAVQSYGYAQPAFAIKSGPSVFQQSVVQKGLFGRTKSVKNTTIINP